MANLTLDQVRSSQAFKALTPADQEQVVNVYDQSKGLDAAPAALSTRDLELFLAEHTPGEKAAQAAAFLRGQFSAGVQLQAPGTRPPGRQPPTKEALADETKILLWKWCQLPGLLAAGAMAGVKTWKDVLARVENELEGPTAKSEAEALKRKYAPLMNTAVTEENLGALTGPAAGVSYAAMRDIGALTLRGESYPISGAALADRLDAVAPDKRASFLERHGIVHEGGQYMIPVALSVTGGFVVAAGTGIESVWQGLVAQGFSQQQIANNPELLAWVAQKNHISDFGSVANGQKIQSPTPDQLNEVVGAVRADLVGFASGIQAVYSDAAKAFVAEMNAMGSPGNTPEGVRSYADRAQQLWNNSQAKRMGDTMRALHEMEMKQIRDLR